MSKEKKIRLKEMSHKKLCKLCKKLGKELQQATSDLKYVSSNYEANKLMVEKWKQQFDAEVYYKKQVQEKASKLSVELTKAEDEIGELKSYARSIEKTLSSEARHIREKNEKLEEKDKRIEEIETAYATSIEALHGEARENRENKKKIEELENALDALGYNTKAMPLNKAVDLGTKILANKVINPGMPIGKLTPFIGELPEDVSMGIDGQLMTEEEEAEKHAAWVAREVARVQQENFDNGQKEFNTLFGPIEEEEQEEQAEGHVPFDEPTNGVEDPYKIGNKINLEGHEYTITGRLSKSVKRDCIGHTPAKPTGIAESDSQRVDMVGALFGVPQADGYIPKSADVDEAVEWAKRNGHHQPEGNPEPNKMDTVKIKSADEISAENIDKHTEMVCNDIAKDESRFL